MSGDAKPHRPGPPQRKRGTGNASGDRRGSRPLRPVSGAGGQGGGVFAFRVCLALFFITAACGYQPVYGGARGARDALHVKLVRSLVADPVAADEVASGVREALARAGVLAAGEAYPRVEIEVLRADEASEGVRASPAGPQARATDVGIVARAWIASDREAEPQAATGDLRAEETLAVDEGATTPDARASAFHHADALRAAARRLGHALGQRVLGLPASSEETGD